MISGECNLMSSKANLHFIFGIPLARANETDVLYGENRAATKRYRLLSDEDENMPDKLPMNLVEVRGSLATPSLVFGFTVKVVDLYANSHHVEIDSVMEDLSKNRKEYKKRLATMIKSLNKDEVKILRELGKGEPRLVMVSSFTG